MSLRKEDAKETTLVSIALVYLCIGTSTHVFGEAIRVGYYSDVFFYTLSTLCVCSAIFLKSQFSRRLHRDISEEPGAGRNSSLQTTVILLVVLLISILVTKIHHNEITSYDLLLCASLSGLVALTHYSQFDILKIQPSLIVPKFRLYFLLACAILLTLGISLRVLVPASWFLTWILVPVNLLILPGFSVGLLVLDSNSSWIERIAYSIPISISLQIIVWLWANLLGAPVFLPLSFSVTTALVLLPALIGMVTVLRS